jgi:uncharacterized protein with GYD domain
MHSSARSILVARAASGRRSGRRAPNFACAGETLGREFIMAIYISLNTLTDQGARNIKETTTRADTFRDAAKKLGVTVKEIYWTLGSYDAVCVLDAPDDSAVAALQASLGAAGNMRTVTLRAFSRDEMGAILARVGK